MVITEETLNRIEDIFGFPLYDWQRDYLLGNIEIISTGRRNGKTFAYCLKMLLSDDDTAERRKLLNFISCVPVGHEKHWLRIYLLDINQKLVENGIETGIEV